MLIMHRGTLVRTTRSTFLIFIRIIGRMYMIRKRILPQIRWPGGRLTTRSTRRCSTSLVRVR